MTRLPIVRFTPFAAILALAACGGTSIGLEDVEFPSGSVEELTEVRALTSARAKSQSTDDLDITISDLPTGDAAYAGVLQYTYVPTATPELETSDETILAGAVPMFLAPTVLIYDLSDQKMTGESTNIVFSRGRNTQDGVVTCCVLDDPVEGTLIYDADLEESTVRFLGTVTGDLVIPDNDSDFTGPVSVDLNLRINGSVGKFDFVKLYIRDEADDDTSDELFGGGTLERVR